MNGGDTLTRPAPELEVGGFYFAGDDQLRVTSWNSLASVAVAVTGRFVHADDGRIEAFSETHTPNTNRTAKSDTYSRAKGWLVDLSVLVTGAAPQRGQTFVRIDVVRGQGAGAIPLSTLIQGYVTATQRLAYPGSPIGDSLSGAGAIRSLTGTDPAAGAEVSETVPTGARWRLMALDVTLVTDGTAANRRTHVLVDDGTNVYYETHNNTAQTATVTLRHAFGAGAALVTSDGVAALGALPTALVLGAGHRFRTSTSGIVAGDNYGAPQYAVEEWLEVG